MAQPLRLTPDLREKVWGRTSLSPWLSDPRQKIGEACYLAESVLPLLVKLIFTSERLSVQVHPSDGDGVLCGKTEMWHILEAEPSATIALGFREPITRERLREAARTGEIEQLLQWFPVKAGETYFTPARTVHAIGGGIVLCEIQQNSDVTYRLWDYGRPREIHLEQAALIADLSVHPGPTLPVTIAEGHELLAGCQYFVTEAIRLRAAERWEAPAGRCPLWIFLEGRGRIGAERVTPGEVWLLPERGGAVLCAETEMRLLQTYVPDGV
jgi:mannose-6-phosphate isomerase